MAGRKEKQAGQYTRLGFETLEGASASEAGAVPVGKQAGVATFGDGEVYRPAPYHKRKTKKRTAPPTELKQATLDDLFSQTSLEVNILPSLPIPIIRAARHAKHNGQYTQLGFDSLAELFVTQGATALAPEPCTGYLEYPFGKGQCKRDRACLHWLQKDMQPR